MAITPTYPHSTVLSKIKFGNTTYYLKDADLRSIVEGFGNATAKDVASNITSTDNGLVTSAQIFDYFGNLTGVLHFRSGSRADQTNPQPGDVVIENTKEYLYDGTTWQELGDEGIWVPQGRTIAGIDLSNDITKARLQEALELAALAYVNTASVTVADYATGITGANYTPTGEINLATDANGYQITGTNSASSVSITPTTSSVLKSVKTAAVAPSFTEGSFTPGSFTKGNAVTAATEGMIAAIDANDTEMLVFSAATTDNVMDYDATFVAPSKAADTFNPGSAAIFDNETVWTGVSEASAAAQTFTGQKIKATFSGTAATITPTLVKESKKITVSPDT